MVNPKQLRLGNYIQDRGGKVLRIDFMEYVRECYDTKLGQLMHLEGQEVHPMTEYTDYANPIPLTEEWLLRLGFEKTSDFGYDKDGFWISLDNYKWQMKGYVCNFDKLPFVHSLQNLYFALTGEELKIKDLDPQNVQ